MKSLRGITNTVRGITNTAKSVFCKFVEILLVARDPLRLRRADLKIAKETFVRIHDRLWCTFPFFSARSFASLLWYLLHCSAIPSVVVNTKGVKVACSTSITLLAYIRFFSFSCWPYICLGLRSL